VVDYDVIVVGAGAAGAPIAARLSEDPDRKVLLIEAGPDVRTANDYPFELRSVSMMSAAMPSHPNNWAFPAQLTHDLGYNVARGRILGGSTALNGAYFVRARKVDTDRWQSMGNDEWAYDKVLPYFIKLEKDLMYGDAPGHGGDGPVPVNRITEHTSLFTQLFYAAAEELGFPYEADKNEMTSNEGYGPLTQNSIDGLRMGTALTYLSPVRNERPNLTIRTKTFVRRVVLEGMRAVGVEVGNRGRGTVIRGGQVILSGGAIKSPHMLLLSGIGPAAELEKVGVTVVHDLPGVGKAFTDHPDILLNFTTRKRIDDPDLKQLFEGVLAFTSPGSPTPGDLEILPMLRPFVRSVFGPSMRGLMSMAVRPAPTMRGMQGSPVMRNVDQLLHAGGYNLVVGMQQPESRGDLTLVSADPTVYPHLEYNYLSDERDRARMRHLLRTAASLVRTNAFKPYFKKLTEINQRTLDDDAKLDGWARYRLGTAIHTASSARMGAPDDPGSVVDQFGRVHGIDNLRIGDTSILPHVPSRGPAATTVMVGEKIADYIRKES
jgi:predicted dehydrogenase (TIGR03970 family)